MKRLLSIAVACLMTLATAMVPLQEAKAQTTVSDYAGLYSAAKVFANATFDTVKVNIPATRSAITFKYDVLKNSGTVAGTVVLKGRVLNTTTNVEQWDTINTYTLTDATATTTVKLTANHYTQYAVIRTTTGTQNSTHSLYLLYRK